ncbi:hypothetical protein DNTS_028815, partial [Danionella cerebrum]
SPLSLLQTAHPPHTRHATEGKEESGIERERERERERSERLSTGIQSTDADTGWHRFVDNESEEATSLLNFAVWVCVYLCVSPPLSGRYALSTSPLAKTMSSSVPPVLIMTQTCCWHTRRLRQNTQKKRERERALQMNRCRDAQPSSWMSDLPSVAVWPSECD